MATENSGISGIGIAAVFAGGILVWSGVKGTAVSGVFRDLISGKDPSKLAQTNPVTAGGILGPLVSALNPVNLLSSPTGGTGASPTVIGTGQGQAFARSLLATIGAPQTAANIQSIMGWIAREGGGGANNPLNTTLPMPGSSNFNELGGGQGVQNYPSVSVGIAANAKTLLGGNYREIVAALRSGQGLCGRSWSELSTWSGGGYSSVC